MAPTPVSRETFERVLFDLGIDYGVADVADVQWMLPNRTWIQTKYLPQLRDYLQRKGLLGYVPEANDCDDFAAEAARLAKRMHARMVRTGKAPKDTALAFGAFWYKQATSGAHAINVALTRYWPDQFELTFIEPQTQQLITLTRSEINSCFRVSF